jgi:hypothetical protein
MSFFDEPPLHDFPDRALRELIAQPANLREVVEHVLPELAPRFRFEQARLLKRELPMPDWRRRELDLLFEVPFTLEDLPPALVCVLVEHQSAEDQSMPLRTLLYAVLFWERQWRAWEERHERGQRLRVSPVVPIVFHTGLERWSTSRTLADLMDVPEALRAFVPAWEPLFWDLAEQTPQELLHAPGIWHQALAVVRAEHENPEVFRQLYQELMDKLALLWPTDRLRWQDLTWFILSWAARRRSAAERQDLVASTLEHYQHQADLMKEFQAVSNKTFVSYEEEVAERIRQHEMAARRETIRVMLEERFGALPEAMQKKINALATPEQFKEAVRQCVRVESLDQLQL